MSTNSTPLGQPLDRRNFVKAATFGTLAWAASRPVAAQATPGYRNGVPFVANPSAAGFTQEQAAQLFTADANATVATQAAMYPQSVASGDPKPNGIVLWTRIDPNQRGGVTPTQVAWQIARTADFAPGSIVVAGVAELDPYRDFTVKLPISNAALQPFTGYFYRFVYNQVASRTGQFKTLPALGSALPQLRLSYIVCQDYGSGYYTALAHLAQEQVDYVVHLGDYIYETISSKSFQNGAVRTVPPFPSGSTTLPVNVDDYRHLYQVYRSDPNQQAVHERFAYIQIWDDHEFANDCHGDFHPDNNTAPNTAATPQPTLRQAANQAWSEYGLADIVFDPSKDWENSIQLYRTFSFGTLAELIVTDERLYRDGPPCGSGQYGQRYFSFGCDETGSGNRSMLGLTQQAWFLNQLQTTKATWKLWANEVMLMQLKFGPLFVSLDQWDGYQHERNLILNTVKHGNIKNFIALTGDLHTFLAGYLKTSFSNPFEHNIGIELMVGSLTSSNFTEVIQSAVDPDDAPVPAKMMGVPPDLIEPIIRSANPWIHYWNSSTHGYAVLTLTPQQLVCEFKAVSTIRQPTADLFPLKTFTVPVNQVKLNS